MKKKYVKPNSSLVKINLLGGILEGETIAGQTRNPVSKTTDEERDDIDWSAKGHDFDVDDNTKSWGDLW